MTAPNWKIKQVIEHAVTQICGLRQNGLWFNADAVELCGRPIDRIRVWGTLHFLARDTPYCCGEPGCHLALVGERLAEINEAVRHGLSLNNPVTVEFENRIAARYHADVAFRSETQQESETRAASESPFAPRKSEWRVDSLQHERWTT